MIFVSVILKKIKIIFFHILYLRCCKIPKWCISNSSNINDYVNIVQITPTQSRFAWNRLPEQKMLENDRIQTVSTEVTSIRRQNDIEKTTGKTYPYFANFESRIHIEISTSNRCHNFHMDSPFKIDEISTNFPCGISALNRWRIDKDVSIGKVSKCRSPLKILKKKVDFA